MTMSKDVFHEIRNINLTNAVIFWSFSVEGTLSSNESCHLKYNFCPQEGVASVTHIQVYFTQIKVCINCPVYISQQNYYSMQILYI